MLQLARVVPRHIAGFVASKIVGAKGQGVAMDFVLASSPQ